MRKALVATLAGLVLAGGGGTAVFLRSDAVDLPALPQPSPTSLPLPERTPLLLALSGGVAPTADGLSLALTKALRDRALGSRVSLSVVDASTGKVLFDRDGGRQVTPASTAKIATAVAALSVLGPDDVLTTRVVAGTAGDVVLVGAGDPLLSEEQLADLGHQLTAVQPRVRRVLVDDRLFVGNRLGPGWKQGYVQNGNVAPVAALSVNGGRTSDREGSPRQQDPALRAGLRFAKLVGARSVVRGQAAPGARQLAHVDSLPVAALVEHMLKSSDNDVAEALGRQVALAAKQEASFVGVAAALTAVLGRYGVRVDLRDASGLSPANRVSPAALATLLARVATEGRFAPVLTGLPVGGFDGTLSDRFQTPSSSLAAGQVRAKTGTLNGVSALAGFVRTREGRLLAFDVTADGVVLGATMSAQGALDRVAAVLAACGCR